MKKERENHGVKKVKTYITGFDDISEGGLPEERTTLICGTAGSGKTIFAVQFLIMGISQNDEGGVFITFEEPPEDIRKNMLGFGWDIAKYEKEGKWAFVDGSPNVGEGVVETGDYNLEALLVRIKHAINKVKAKRISMDSLGSIFSQFTDASKVRYELFRIASSLKNTGVTSLMTAERTEDYGEIARFGIEEFVVDNVIIIRNVLEQEKRRRTVEILKLRGTSHQKGEYPFTIAHEGIVVIRIASIRLDQKSSNIRISTGLPELDQMCGGGYFRDSIILVSGATGTGKSLMATEFISGGTNKGEKCLLFAFEESHDQLLRNARSWGVDFKEMEKKGTLRIICSYPESRTMEEHLLLIKNNIEEFNPKLIAVDSLSALDRVATVKSFREFVIGITSFIKKNEMAGLFTAVTPTLLGGVSHTEAHISTITDSIILLRYVEMFGEMQRGITVLKMRGSRHDKDIRQYHIDHEGMHIGKPFCNVSGIISGNVVHTALKQNIKVEGLSSLDDDDSITKPLGT